MAYHTVLMMKKLTGNGSKELNIYELIKFVDPRVMKFKNAKEENLSRGEKMKMKRLAAARGSLRV